MPIDPGVRWLLAGVVTHALVALFAGLALVVFPAAPGELHHAIKPLKFGISITIFLGTWAILLPHLDLGPRLRLVAAILLVGTMVVESACIVVQAMRGRGSHFNSATALDAALWNVMVAAIVLTTATLVILALVATFRPLGVGTSFAVSAGSAVDFSTVSAGSAADFFAGSAGSAADFSTGSAGSAAEVFAVSAGSAADFSTVSAGSAADVFAVSAGSAADFFAGSAGSAADFSTVSAGSAADFSTVSAGSAADFSTVSAGSAADLSPTLRFAWRAALWILLLVAVSGFGMGGRLQHSVGASTAEPGSRCSVGAACTAICGSRTSWRCTCFRRCRWPPGASIVSSRIRSYASRWSAPSR